MKIFVLKNSAKEYGRFDIYGWDSTTVLSLASRFCTKEEADDHAKAINYVTPCPRNDYKVKTLKVTDSGPAYLEVDE